MKIRTKQVSTTIAAALTGMLFASCEVNQTEEGELPEVEVKGGKLPKYDVDAGDVDIETKKKTIEVEVPTGIDFDSPAEDEAEDGTE